jgi:hypothetical protein
MKTKSLSVVLLTLGALILGNSPANAVSLGHVTGSGTVHFLPDQEGQRVEGRLVIKASIDRVGTEGQVMVSLNGVTARGAVDCMNFTGADNKRVTFGGRLGNPVAGYEYYIGVIVDKGAPGGTDKPDAAEVELTNELRPCSYDRPGDSIAHGNFTVHN